MLCLILVTFTVVAVEAYKDFRIPDEGRSVPSWDRYPYLMGNKGGGDDYMIFREYVLREEDGHSFILCPAGFAIAQLASALVVPRNLTAKDPSLATLAVPYVQATTLMHFPFGFGDRAPPPPTAGQPDDPCPTLKHCLLHQVGQHCNDLFTNRPALIGMCVRLRQRVLQARPLARPAQEPGRQCDVRARPQLGLLPERGRAQGSQGAGQKVRRGRGRSRAYQVLIQAGGGRPELVFRSPDGRAEAGGGGLQRHLPTRSPGRGISRAMR